MFGFISGKSLQAEARAALAEFARVCPPPDKSRKSKPVAEPKIAESLATLKQRLAAYAKTQRLSFLGRARLAKALQSEMQAQGYPGDLVSRVVGAVTVSALVAPERRA
jgi:hypothetical protein